MARRGGNVKKFVKGAFNAIICVALLVLTDHIWHPIDYPGRVYFWYGAGILSGHLFSSLEDVA